MKLNDPFNEFPLDTTIIKIHNKGVITISDLSKFKKLQYLNLSGNKIAKIENLEKLDHLEELIISNNLLTEIKNIKNCSKLWKVILDGNQIKELLLDELPLKVHTLLLRKNKIKKINPGNKTFNELDSLSLTKNFLSHLEGIEQFPNITHLAVEGKSLKSMSKATYNFIVRKQMEDKEKKGPPFYFHTSNKTTRESVVKYVEKQKIEIV